VTQEEAQELKKRLQQAEDKIKQLEEDLRLFRHKWEMLFQSKGMPADRRTQRLRMRCTTHTKTVFKAFIIDGKFETQEDALSWLLQKYSDQIFSKEGIHIAR
jgi:predicted RNase H-like nuclease (RuvC/YqgF family)